jgi:DNA mismatch endonuclease (patch repair protein)
VEFWEAKLTANAARDARNEAALRSEGWRVVVVWECETRDEDELRAFLLGELDAESHGGVPL